jgi:hypothetical protein
MTKKFTPVLIPLILLLYISPGLSQPISVTSGLTPNQLAAIIVNDSSVKFSNVNYIGATVASGSFTGPSGNNLKLTDGIILTSGLATYAKGPNTQPGCYNNNFMPGDFGLDTWSGKLTFDACILEFDLVPTYDTLYVQYVFASEEYPEFCDPSYSYNDVFGFFLMGNGLPGLLNFAWAPGTSIPPKPVSVQNISPFVNSAYYVSNAGGTSVQYDGFTKVMEATIGVTRGATYRIRLAVADAGDGVYDTGVFIRAKGLGSRSKLPTVVPLQMLSVTAKPYPGYNRIEWTTASEKGTEFFEVERSLNGRDFEPIAKLSAAGNSIDKRTYSYNDLLGEEYKIAYYRIKTTDREGKSTLSGVSTLSREALAFKIKNIMPNPVNGNQMKLNLYSPSEVNADLIITDMLGKTVLSRDIHLVEGDNDVLLEDLSPLSKGLYTISVYNEQMGKFQRLISRN